VLFGIPVLLFDYESLHVDVASLCKFSAVARTTISSGSCYSYLSFPGIFGQTFSAALTVISISGTGPEYSVNVFLVSVYQSGTGTTITPLQMPQISFRSQDCPRSLGLSAYVDQMATDRVEFVELFGKISDPVWQMAPADHFPYAPSRQLH
jgi:hypothetical protein